MRSARLLVTYLPTLLLALVLGTIIWVTAVREPDPVQNVLIQVPLVPDMTPEQILLNNLPETVQVQIRAKQSILDQLSAGNYSAVVDLASAPYGQTTQLVTLQPPIEGAEEIVLFPEGVDVRLDRQITRDIPIIVTPQGNVAPGYVRNELSLDPPMLKVIGPESIVTRLVEARTNVFLDNAKETFSVTRRPILYDDQGNIVGTGTTNLSVDPETVSITIPIEEQEGVREKAITPRWVGDPANGYRLLSVTVDPITALVSGSPAVLDNLISVPTAEVDVDGLKQTTVSATTLDLPPSVTWEDPKPITVTVEIEPIKTSAVVTKPPEILALGTGLTATLSTDEVRVFLFGPLEILDSVIDDVNVVVDLFGLGTGTFVVEPSIIVPVESIEVRSFQPSQITVRISEIMTDTVTSTLGTLPLPLPVTFSAETPSLSRLANPWTQPLIPPYAILPEHW